MRTVEFRFDLASEVYDKARRQNGVIVTRRYQQFIDSNEYAYYVCYGGPEKVEYEWTSAEWLTLGHRIE